ncbi:hypothetical protein ACFQ9X_05465 [Catenulispora yoronensis]
MDRRRRSVPRRRRPGRTPGTGPGLRDRVLALRAGAARLRGARRRIGAVAVSLLLAAAIGAACTAWFDGVAGAADRAAVVALAVDSVVDGDPAAARYDAANTSATAQYVVELANNSPTAVTVASVGFDAGTLMSSTGWKPAAGGSPRIAAGATARITLTVRLFCPMVVMGVQTGNFGAGGRGVNGSSAMPFPALDVKVLDGNGDERTVTLATRITVDSLLHGENGSLTFLGSGFEPTPQIVTADAGACSQWETDREQQVRERDLADPAQNDPERGSAGLVLTYDKVVTPAANKSFTLAVDVRNTTQNPLTLSTRVDAGYIQDPALHTTWLPARLDIAPGQTEQVRLTVEVRDCGSVQAGLGGRINVATLAEALLQVDDPASGASLPISPTS